MLKKAAVACLLGLLLLLAACAPNAPADAGHQAAVESFGMAAMPGALAPTLPPTPTPTASPAPTATPRIQAEWYYQRNADLLELLPKNAVFATQDELLAAIGRMDIDPDKPMVALTFDDGPTRGVTDEILDVLERYNGRATFFVVGRCVPGKESLLRRAVSLGCEIGCHTWDHDDLTEISEQDARETIQRTNQAVFDATGYVVKSLRPPGGASNKSVKALAASLDLALVFWSHSTHDYRIKSAEKVAELVFYDSENKHTLQDGDIVLMHDLREYTSDAMESIVSGLVQQGYQLVTVQELLHLSPDGFKPGGSYKKQ